MDRMLDETLRIHYGNPKGVSTDEFYNDYLNVCKRFGKEPRTKCVVIRETCKELELEIKTKQVKYFD